MGNTRTCMWMYAHTCMLVCAQWEVGVQATCVLSVRSVCLWCLTELIHADMLQAIAPGLVRVHELGHAAGSFFPAGRF